MRQSPLSRPPTDRLARSGSPKGHLISILLLLVITTTTTASATTTTGPQTDSYGTSSIYYYQQQSPPPLLLLLVHPQSHMATSSTLLTCRHLQLIICGTVWVLWTLPWPCSGRRAGLIVCGSSPNSHDGWILDIPLLSRIRIILFTLIRHLNPGLSAHGLYCNVLPIKWVHRS